MSEPVRNRRRPWELTEDDVASAVGRIRARDADLADEAEHVVGSLTWGEGAGLISQSGLQEWLWYMVPTKYLTDEVGYMGRLAETASLTDAGRAAALSYLRHVSTGPTDSPW